MGFLAGSPAWLLGWEGISTGLTVPSRANPGSQRCLVLYEFRVKGNICLVRSIAGKTDQKEVPCAKNSALEMGLPKLGFTWALVSVFLSPVLEGFAPCLEEDGRAASA